MLWCAILQGIAGQVAACLCRRLSDGGLGVRDAADVCVRASAVLAEGVRATAEFFGDSRARKLLIDIYLEPPKGKAEATAIFRRQGEHRTTADMLIEEEARATTTPKAVESEGEGSIILDIAR